MIINKVTQSLAKNFCADGKIRPTLAGVFFTKNKAVATNSFKLCEIEYKTHKSLGQDISIHKDYINNLNPKKDYDLIDDNGKIAFSSVDELIYLKEMNCNFPDYECFFQNDGTLEIGFGVDEMMELLQVYKKAGVRGIKMKLGNPLQPLLFVTNGSEYELSKNGIKEIKSILMPLKI